jgi:hypothetical protein
VEGDLSTDLMSERSSKRYRGTGLVGPRLYPPTQGSTMEQSIFGFQVTIATSPAAIFPFHYRRRICSKAAWIGDEKFMPRQEPGEKIA